MRQGAISVEPISDRMRPRRRIVGVSAVLMPLDQAGQPDHDVLAATSPGEQKRAFPGLLIVGSACTDLQECLPYAAQRQVCSGAVDFTGQRRMLLAYSDSPADVLAGRCLDRKRPCRSFSDCTTAPRHRLVSGCYPLDPFYKARPQREQLVEIKTAR